MRERDVRCALKMDKLMILLLYKEAYLNKINHNPFLPSIVVSLLHEFHDVLLKVPLIREIEHQIDFAPGTAILNRPAYRSNFEETKELQR